MNNSGVVRITTNFHQTTIIALDTSKNIIAWSSASSEHTPGHDNLAILSYNASKEVAMKLREIGIDNVEVIVRGPGVGRESAMKALKDNGIDINLIKDKTPIPHNGCFPMKRKIKKYVRSNQGF